MERNGQDCTCCRFDRLGCRIGRKKMYCFQGWHGRVIHDWNKSTFRIQVSKSWHCTYVWPWRTYDMLDWLCPNIFSSTFKNPKEQNNSSSFPTFRIRSIIRRWAHDPIRMLRWCWLSLWMPSMANCTFGPTLVQIGSCHEWNNNSKNQSYRHQWTRKWTRKTKSSCLVGCRALPKNKELHWVIKKVKATSLYFYFPYLPSRWAIQCHLIICLYGG